MYDGFYLQPRFGRQETLEAIRVFFGAVLVDVRTRCTKHTVSLLYCCTVLVCTLVDRDIVATGFSDAFIPLVDLALALTSLSSLSLSLYVSVGTFLVLYGRLSAADRQLAVSGRIYCV